jgi:hypothetical protein
MALCQFLLNAAAAAAADTGRNTCELFIAIAMARLINKTVFFITVYSRIYLCVAT